MPPTHAKETAEEKRLKRAQDDAAAFTAEVKAVIRAQRHQIAVLERQAQQLANEAAAEQRFAGAVAFNDKGSKLARLQQEHAALGADLDREGRRALDLAARVEVADAGRADLRSAVSLLTDGVVPAVRRVCTTCSSRTCRAPWSASRSSNRPPARLDRAAARVCGGRRPCSGARACSWSGRLSAPSPSCSSLATAARACAATAQQRTGMWKWTR